MSRGWKGLGVFGGVALELRSSVRIGDSGCDFLEITENMDSVCNGVKELECLLIFRSWGMGRQQEGLSCP